MQLSTDVVVIGGGVIGSLAAYELRKKGMHVVVCESGTVGQQASSAAAGLLAPYRLLAKHGDKSLALQRASLALFPSLVQEIEQRTGICVEYHETGTLRLASVGQLTRLQRWADTWSELGVPMQVLQGDQVTDFEPSVSRVHTVGVSIPLEPQLRATSFMRAVAKAARVSGAVFLEQRSVMDIDRCGALATAVRTAQGDVIGCSHVVVAAGAWSGRCSNFLGVDLPVAPLQGQGILLSQPAQRIRHIIFGDGVYVAPKQDSTLVVGSTYDEVGFDCRVTADGVARLLSAARLLVPSLSAGEVLQAWAGLRPRTPDRRPILGPAPGWENVTLACGHNGLGILLSAITARATGELVETGKIPEVIQPFTSQRFLSSVGTSAA